MGSKVEVGQKVLVKWAKSGWLPGVVTDLSTPDPGEKFQRVKVAMENGWACHGSGFHPDCVMAAGAFKVGDAVTMTNDYGVVFEGKKVIGIADDEFAKENGPRYFIAPTDTPWFSVHEKSLVAAA